MNNLTTRALSGSIMIAIFTAMFLLNSQAVTLIAYALISTVILGEISYNVKMQNAPKPLEYIAYAYVCTPVLSMVYIFFCPGPNYNVSNIFFMSLLTGCVFDTFAYLGGKLVGGPKIAPKISPSKTISGTCIGFLAVFAAYTIIMKHDTLLKRFIISLAGSSGSFFGDLLQSKFKRALGIKDMGSLIPGHGGFGDRFDGFIGVVFVYMFLYFCGCM